MRWRCKRMMDSKAVRASTVAPLPGHQWNGVCDRHGTPSCSIPCSKAIDHRTATTWICDPWPPLLQTLSVPLPLPFPLPAPREATGSLAMCRKPPSCGRLVARRSVLAGAMCVVSWASAMSRHSPVLASEALVTVAGGRGVPSDADEPSRVEVAEGARGEARSDIKVGGGWRWGVGGVQGVEARGLGAWVCSQRPDGGDKL